MRSYSGVGLCAYAQADLSSSDLARGTCCRLRSVPAEVNSRPENETSLLKAGLGAGLS